MNREPPIVLCDDPHVGITSEAIADLKPFLLRAEQELGAPAAIILAWAETWTLPPGVEVPSPGGSSLETYRRRMGDVPGAEHEFQVTVGADEIARLDSGRRLGLRTAAGLPIVVELSSFREIMPATGLIIGFDRERNRLCIENPSS